MTETFVPFRSSNLESATWDEATSDLVITFRSGRSYLYRSVPRETFMGLQNAQSAGTYFARQIKDRYAAEEQ